MAAEEKPRHTTTPSRSVPEDDRLRADPAPYTFVEGFLQLARPLVPPAKAKDGSSSSKSSGGSAAAVVK